VQANFSNNKKGNNRIIDTGIFQPTGILHQCCLIWISFQASSISVDQNVIKAFGLLETVK
jgi:hypothetical protein